MTDKKTPLLILIIGLIATALLQQKAVLWIVNAWRYSRLTDGQGPIIFVFAIIAGIILWRRNSNGAAEMGKAGFYLLGLTLFAKIVSDQVHINILGAMSLGGCLVAIFAFIYGFSAIDRFLPLWILVFACMPTLPYLFDLVINGVFVKITDLILAAIVFIFRLDPSNFVHFWLWLASVKYGNFLSSPVFIFSYATLFSVLFWKNFKTSWKSLVFLWLQIPIIRLCAATFLAFALKDNTMRYVTTLSYLFFCTLFFGLTTGVLLWKQKQKAQLS